MKTVSMGTSAREGARGERRQSLAHVLQLLLQEEDLSLSLSLQDGMGWSQSSTHTYTQTYMEWAAADCLGEGGMEGEDKCMYVRTAGRACLGGVAEEEHLTRHCQGTHE